LDAMNGGVVGVFIAPTTKSGCWEAVCRTAHRNSPVHHRMLSGVPATSPGHWILTVGASVFWGTGQSGGAPDRHCSVSGAPPVSALTLARTVAHLMPYADDRWREVAVALLAHRTVRCATGHCPVLHLSGTIIRGTLKAPNSQLVTPISIKLQRPDGCD
jgi:hypothetical protein